MKTVKTICFECHSRCGVILEVEDNQIVRIKGDKEHPFSRGFTCQKAMACMEIIYHPDRITKPLLRVGKRGEGKWESISWDHALGTISKRLLDLRENWGAESLVLGRGTSRGLDPAAHRFLSLYGSPNYQSPSNMSGGPLRVGNVITCGFDLYSSPDLANSKCILLWASNPEQAFAGLYMNDIRDALKIGAKLIVVDPRGIPLAKKSDHWLRPRPQTDLALALGFIRVIIKNGLYDKDFVKRWTEGFDELLTHVEPFTPERCEEITWVPAKEIEAAALAYGSTRPASVFPGGAGAAQMANAFDFNRAITVMAAITGNLEVPGGNIKHISPIAKQDLMLDPMVKLPHPQRKKRLSLYRFPIWDTGGMPSELTWRAIIEEEPYPVKALGLFANNAICAFANSSRVKEALEKVDFLFVADYFHTPTTALSDIVLPAAHWTERNDIEELLMRSHIFCQPKAVDPVGECRDERQIMIDLARKIGLDEPWQSAEQLLDYRLEPIGMTFQALKKMGYYKAPVKYKSYEDEGGFNTPSGKVEICIPKLSQIGGFPLPTYIEPPETPVSRPDLLDDYPLILITGGRNIAFYHSAHRNIPSLRRYSPEPELTINGDTARELGLEEGEWVWLISPRKRIEIKLNYDSNIHPKVVHAPHGYWYGVENGWNRLNINMITDNVPICPVTGSVPTRSLLCRVEKMGSQAHVY